MNRRSLLASVPVLLAFTPQRDDTAGQVAEIVYGPAPITSPKGETFWMLATAAGAFFIPEYDAVFTAAKTQAEFATAIRALGEWVLIQGRPHHWNRQLARWEMLV